MPNQPEVCRRFNELPWHDSELRCISVNYSIGSDNRGGHYEVFLRVNLQARNNVESKEQFLPIEIRFFQTSSMPIWICWVSGTAVVIFQAQNAQKSPSTCDEPTIRGSQVLI
jgi:hypothetical protein